MFAIDASPSGISETAQFLGHRSSNSNLTGQLPTTAHRSNKGARLMCVSVQDGALFCLDPESPVRDPRPRPLMLLDRLWESS